MTRPPLIIDVHGHYTTAPAALGDWRNLQIKALTDPSVIADPNSLHISDDELRDSISLNQLAKMKERGSDLTIFSPRASFMAHHIGDFQTSINYNCFLQFQRNERILTVYLDLCSDNRSFNFMQLCLIL